MTAISSTVNDDISEKIISMECAALDRSGKVDAPKPLYKENPDLDKNEFKKIDYEGDGLDVIVYRTVTRDGETIHKDTIKTHYLPYAWQIHT